MTPPWGEILGMLVFGGVVVALHFIGKALMKIFPGLKRKKVDQPEEADEYYGIPW
jgi:hypothetical protein